MSDKEPLYLFYRCVLDHDPTLEDLMTIPDIIPDDQIKINVIIGTETDLEILKKDPSAKKYRYDVLILRKDNENNNWETKLHPSQTNVKTEI
jgi:hypothetical protein